MAHGDSKIQFFDVKTAKEWFQLIEDGVPEDVALQRLEEEATNAGGNYRSSYEYIKDYIMEEPFVGIGEPRVSTENLTKAEELAIRMYTTEAEQFYLELNKDYRCRKWRKYFVYTNLLHSVCMKLRNKPLENRPDQIKSVLYRGVKDIVDSIPSGDFCWPGFTSTSPSKEIATQFGKQIFTMECQTGAPVKEFSECFEYEVLFSPFHVFRNSKQEETGYIAWFLSAFFTTAKPEKPNLNFCGMTQPTSFFLSFPHFRGTLLGSAVGNCLGTPFEFKDTPTLKCLLDVIKHLDIKDKSKGQFRYSSDVSMTIALAKSLSENNGLVISHLAKCLYSEYKDNPYRNYGGSVAAVLEDLNRLKLSDDAFAPAKKLFDGSGSHGNGGAMRISPAALFFFKSSDEDFVDKITKICKVTHSHVEGINGAVLQASAVRLALEIGMERPWKTDIRDQFLDSLTMKIKRLEPRSAEIGCSFTGKLRKLKEFLATPPSRKTVRKELGNGMSAMESVPTAIYCFLRGLNPIPHIPSVYTPFERTIIYAISLGGDTDTIASMAGAIAGAYHGQDAIPQKWRDACEARAIEDAKIYAKTIHNKVFD